MKNIICVLRFGSPHPVKAEFNAIEELTEGTLAAIGVPVNPLGILTVLITKHTPDEIVEVFKKHEQENNDVLPSVIWKHGHEVALSFPVPDITESVEMLIERFKDFYEEDSEEKPGECNMTLDQLLDKVSRTGVDGLSEAELTRLKSFSAK